MTQPHHPAPVIVVLGVSGSGKTTVGKLLATRLGLPFHDADDFHSAANKAKMAAGTPLNDADRQPWLEDLAQHIGTWQAANGAVLACSALKEAYRHTLQQQADKRAVRWVFLDGPTELLRSRIGHRKNHYMGVSMLDSQLATLEKPTYGVQVSVDATPAQIVEQVVEQLGKLAPV